ncbi:MAG: UDP-4-amino-4,6-dideoxy-N-acetyl-beta-L-altrosamine transaminase [Chitinophagales bacterium]
MKIIPYGKQFIDEEDIAEVVKVLRCDWLTTGPRVEEFEDAVAHYCGVKFAVAFNSGTSALHAAMYAAGLGPGDEVITCPLTFVATANSVLYTGAKPVFTDIDPTTYCIDINQIEDKINSRTKAILPIDYAGYPVDLARLREVAERHGLLVIEDAAHALGAVRNGIPVGKEADMTMFSFHPVKHITTGEGGMIVTGDEELANKLRLFRSHGIVRDPAKMEAFDGGWYYEMHDLGHNYRITDIQCALGLSQFKKLNSFLNRRQEIADRYREAMGQTDWLAMPPEPDYGRHAYHIFSVLVQFFTEGNISEARKNLFDYLHSRGIGVQVHYLPVHLHPYYRKNLGTKSGDFPHAEKFYSQQLSLPMYPSLSSDEQDYVVHCLLNFLLDRNGKL